MPQLIEVVEVAHPQKLLLESAEESLDAAVALGLAHEGGQIAGRGRPKIASPNFREAIDKHAGEALVQVAKAVGLSRTTYAKVASIIAAAEKATGTRGTSASSTCGWPATRRRRSRRPWES